MSMKISTKGRYALRVMVDLARNQQLESGYMPLKDIAARQNLTVKYLEQIIALLTRAGFLLSVRGMGGGYRLARAADAYSVGEILRAAEGNLAPVNCLCEGRPACPRSAQCETLPVWQGLQKVIGDYLDGITLMQVCQGRACPQEIPRAPC